MEIKISMTVRQLEILLDDQKRLVVEALRNTSYYNTENTDSHSKTIDNIDKEKFKELGMKARYPDELSIIKKYLS
jgi:hypothetical protein